MVPMSNLMKVAGAAVVAAVFLVLSGPKIIEILDAGEIMVIQYPNGSLEAYADPGMYFQWYGTVTKYPRREQYSFVPKGEEGKQDQALRISFNDGGGGSIAGVVSWEMPKTPDLILKAHKEFRSPEGIDQQLIRPAIENALFFSGPLMSSTESSAERRAELLQFINDQLQNGIYLTQRTTRQVVDPVTNLNKEVNASDVVRDEKGQIKRVSESPLTSFGIRMFPATINRITYDEVVQKQIAERQKQITEVQTAIAQATKAEQRAITVAKEGEASAAEAKWKQEVIKATEVTRAEQELQVANLNTKTAEARKNAMRLEGEGEAARRTAIMSADGGLDKKLSAYVEVNKAYAEAMSKGKMVPDIALGATANGAASAANMMELLTVKTARDLSLDIGMTGNTKRKD